jgi:hypothetical protein
MSNVNETNAAISEDKIKTRKKKGSEGKATQGCIGFVKTQVAGYDRVMSIIKKNKKTMVRGLGYTE